jgi:F-type H+-transporting ATPase subunit delta
MSAELIAKRYAKALKEVADGDLDKIKSFLESLKSITVLFEDINVAKVLMSPVVPISLKVDVLKFAAEQVNCAKEVVLFLELVGRAGRASIIPVIVSELEKLVYLDEGLVEAELITVIELSDDDLESVKTKIEEIVGKSVILKQKVDQSILGGFVARFGNNVLDMSLKSKLRAMSQTAAR